MNNEWNAEETFRRADAALSQGKPWRAKEIYRGCIGNAFFNAELYERYGRLLEELGDRFEAGRFLFLSGVRKPQYAEAIELYLKRYNGKL